MEGVNLELAKYIIGVYSLEQYLLYIKSFGKKVKVSGCNKEIKSHNLVHAFPSYHSCHTLLGDQ
jgi:hypothetical protein